MSENHVIGIDLGTRKSGVCWIAGNHIAVLQTITTVKLIAELTEIERQQRPPSIVVVDAPIDPTAVAGFRDIDRVFMRGLFNNNHVGLQPNNPDLLNMLGEIEALMEWCEARGIQYSNDFNQRNQRLLRETMPNTALGILAAPNDLLILKRRLRFRYGRGSNVAPIIVAYECLEGHPPTELFQPLVNAPMDWNALEQFPQNMAQVQSDDLIAAMVCGSLAWWQANSDETGYVREERGHYLLPPARMIHQEWVAEICRILGHADFAAVETNLCPIGQAEE